MKKSLILLALPALLLSGCSKEISKEDAKKRAQEIVDHEVKLEDFKKVHVETEDEGSIEGNVNGSQKTKSVVEYSVEDKWVHSLSVSEGKEGEEAHKSERESWAYQEDGKYYVVNRSVVDGVEKKTYALYQETDLLWELEKVVFDATFDGLQVGALGELAGKETLKMVITAIDGGDTQGTTFDLKYYSTGEGNLTLEGKTVDSAFEVYGYKGEVTSTGKVVYDKYVLAENSMTSEGTLKNEEEKEVKYKDSTKVTYSYEVTVAKPDLSGYEQGEAD